MSSYSIGIFSIASNLHQKEAVRQSSEEFLRKIEEQTHIPATNCEDDFSDYGKYDLNLILIQTGGSEEKFLKLFPTLSGPFYLLATNENNSLAASMEILSFIREKGLIAEILHGRPEYIGSRITTLVSFRRAIRSIRGSKFGVIGKPSNWLIASSGDYSSPLKRYLDAELVDITMEEFLLEVKKEDFPPNADAPFVGKYDENTLKKAMHIYGALRRLVDKYHLSALTVRCFDLLGMLCNTSCLGLALLNKEGITASCEGDVPAMVSMVILRALTGQSSFQSNPSTIDVPTNTLTLAHCTVPLDMVDAFELHSHFESGLGVAVRGTIQPGNVTIFKCSGDLSRYFVSNAHLEQNLTSEHLCRTQIIVKPEKSVDYFLRDSIGNHHIVVRGHHAEVVDEFFRALKGSS